MDGGRSNLYVLDPIVAMTVNLPSVLKSSLSDNLVVWMFFLSNHNSTALAIVGSGFRFLFACFTYRSCAYRILLRHISCIS
jgi:hypothetical protein